MGDTLGRSPCQHQIWILVFSTLLLMAADGGWSVRSSTADTGAESSTSSAASVAPLVAMVKYRHWPYDRQLGRLSPEVSTPAK